MVFRNCRMKIRGIIFWGDHWWWKIGCGRRGWQRWLRWRRSLEATVKIRLKTRSKRHKSKSWEHQRTPDCRELNSQELIKQLHTYSEHKHHPRANKFQSKAYNANSPATQEHSTELQYTGCPKLFQTHWHLITHYWTLHCTPERRNPAPPTRTPTQASLTRKPWQATRPTPPTARNLHNKENSTNFQNTEKPPQMQEYKQDEETEEYPAGKGTG